MNKHEGYILRLPEHIDNSTTATFRDMKRFSWRMLLFENTTRRRLSREGTL